MRSLILTALLVPTIALAGSPSDLDFWLGDWVVEWPGGQGTNRVERILDGKVIQESFDGRPAIRLAGRSLSVHDAGCDCWRQTWVDNQGQFMVFSGGPTEDGDFVLSRHVERDGQTLIQRMVFTDITPGGFLWRWEQSEDGGRSWKLLWPIRYRRAGDGDAAR